MLTRFNKFLIGALAVQAALVVIVLLSGGESTLLKEEPVLPGFTAASVTRVQVFAEGGDKPKVELAKRGNNWVLASHFDYPVEAQKVTDMLAPIAKMMAAEPIATTAARHKQLKVADTDFDRKLVVTADGKDTVLYIGTSAGLRRNAIRVGTDERVLAVTGLTPGSINVQARDWVKRTYYETPRGEITKVVIERGPSTVALEHVPPPAAGSGSAGSGSARAGSGSATPPAFEEWKVTIDGAPLVLAAGEKLDQPAIDTVFGNMASLDASPADPKRDATTPTAIVTVHRKGGTDSFDIIGAGEYYWVKQRGSDRATLVDKDRLKDVVELDRSKLVTKPPAPAPAPAPPGAPGKGSGAPILPRPPIPPRP